MSIRCLNYINNGSVISTNENIIVIDNGYDQTIVNINAFLIESFAGIQFNARGGGGGFK